MLAEIIFKNNKEREEFIENYNQWQNLETHPLTGDKIWQVIIPGFELYAIQEIHKKEPNSWIKDDGDGFYSVVEYFLLPKGWKKQGLTFRNFRRSKTELIKLLSTMKK